MAQKISIVIPNFNGRGLLEKNLPIVLKNCPTYEVIVVDDGSSDDSVNFIKKNFPKFRLIIFKKNRGFAKAVNTGVKKATGDLVVLLNSDVSPRENFLKFALEHFKNSQNGRQVFAVGFADCSHEDGKIIIRGRGGAKFEKGFLSHFAVFPKAGETLWVSGGSAIFDKKKFLELKGFDPVFAPFYWEDIDLSFRAQLKGYICIFEPRSKVDHFHQEGAIKKQKSNFFIKTVSYKNQFLFVWKNISDYLLLLKHLYWFPYHFIKAAVKFDIAFFLGFLWAIFKIPQLIVDWKLEIGNWKLSDKEVIEKFEKQ